jgi:hypothetical protein
MIQALESLWFIFPFFKDLAVLYREKYKKGRVQVQNLDI